MSQKNEWNVWMESCSCSALVDSSLAASKMRATAAREKLRNKAD